MMLEDAFNPYNKKFGCRWSSTAMTISATFFVIFWPWQSDKSLKSPTQPWHERSFVSVRISMDVESMVEGNSTALSVVARITSAPKAISSFARWVAQGPFPMTNVVLFKIVTFSKFDFPFKYKRRNRLSTGTFHKLSKYQENVIISYPVQQSLFLYILHIGVLLIFIQYSGGRFL